MPQEANMLYYFLIAAVVLGIAFGGREYFAAFVSNFTQQQTTLQTGGSASLHFEQTGSVYEYDITVQTAFTIKPTPRQDMEAVAAVTFKGETVRAVTATGEEFFVIDEGSLADNIPFKANMRSTIPPIERLSLEHVEKPFSLGKEYAITNRDVPSGTFKVGLVDASATRDSLFGDAKCRAKFSVECEDVKKFTPYLTACKSNEIDATSLGECTHTAELCGGSVTIRPFYSVPSERIDCNAMEVPKVAIDTEGGTEWEARETIKLSIFRRTGCTEGNRPDEWIGKCSDQALLLNHIFETDI